MGTHSLRVGIVSFSHAPVCASTAERESFVRREHDALRASLEKAGIKESIEPNPVSAKGYPTYVDFRKDTPRDFRLIMATIPVGKDFTGVVDIVRKDAGSVTVVGRGGQKIDVPCRVDALKD
jgi:hypothetical protein